MGGESCGEVLGLRSVQELILGMVEFETGLATSHLTIATNMGANLEGVFLCSTKVKEAQANDAAMIFDSTDEATAPTESHLSCQNFAFDLQFRANAAGGNGTNSRSVLVAQRQVK